MKKLFIPVCLLLVGCAGNVQVQHPEGYIFHVLHNGDVFVISRFRNLGKKTDVPTIVIEQDTSGWYYAKESIKPGATLNGIETNMTRLICVRLADPQEVDGRLKFFVPGIGNIEVLAELGSAR